MIYWWLDLLPPVRALREQLDGARRCLNDTARALRNARAETVAANDGWMAANTALIAERAEVMRLRGLLQGAMVRGERGRMVKWVEVVGG